MKIRTQAGGSLRLPVVGLGCWALGGKSWGPVDDNVAVATVHAALDLGVNWLDTAPIYGDGHADEVVVKALRSADRDAIIPMYHGGKRPLVRMRKSGCLFRQ